MRIHGGPAAKPPLHTSFLTTYPWCRPRGTPLHTSPLTPYATPQRLHTVLCYAALSTSCSPFVSVLSPSRADPSHATNPCPPFSGHRDHPLLLYHPAPASRAGCLNREAEMRQERRRRRGEKRGGGGVRGSRTLRRAMLDVRGGYRGFTGLRGCDWQRFN